MTVLPESTAHALCILNSHQSRRCYKYIKFYEWQCVEEMGSEALSDSKGGSEMASEN